MSKLLPGFALSASVSLLLSACGGSDSGGVPTGPTSPPMTSYVGSSDAIAAWADPATLAFDGPTIGSYAGKRQVMRGTVDPITGVDLGQLAGVEMWKGSDGHVYVLDLTVDSTGVPGAVQASTEAGATVDDACTFNGTQSPGQNYDYTGVLFSADLVTPGNSAYIYRLPGADGVCGTADDVVHLVHPNMTSAVAPIVGAAMPATTVYNASGSITGYVAKSGTDLVLLDASLANPVILATYSAGIGVADPLPIGLETGYPTSRLFVVDGNIVNVDYAAHTVSPPLFAIPNWTPTDDHLVTAASPTTLYFAVNTPASGALPASATIYAMPADGSAGPTVMSVQVGQVRELQFPVQGTQLVAGVSDGVTYAIVAIPQGQVDGSAGTVIAADAALDSGRFTATANAVYYTMWATSVSGTTTTRSSTTAGIVGIDGTLIQAPVADAQFLSGGELDPWPAGDTTTQRMPFTTMFEVTGLTPTTVLDPATGITYIADGVAGGSLSSIDVASNTSIATLGSFPAASTATLLEGSFRGIGHAVFIEASTLASTQDPATRELFLVNSHGAGSLVQVTNNLGF